MRLRRGWPRSKKPPFSKLLSSSSNDLVSKLLLLLIFFFFSWYYPSINKSLKSKNNTRSKGIILYIYNPLRYAIWIIRSYMHTTLSLELEVKQKKKKREKKRKRLYYRTKSVRERTRVGVSIRVCFSNENADLRGDLLGSNLPTCLVLGIWNSVSTTKYQVASAMDYLLKLK